MPSLVGFAAIKQIYTGKCLKNVTILHDKYNETYYNISEMEIGITLSKLNITNML